jgi:hypothetical protein
MEQKTESRVTKFPDGTLGCAFGFCLSIAYIVAAILIFIVFIIADTSSPQTSSTEEIKAILLVSVFGVFIALLIAVLPSVFIGLVTGVAIITIAEDFAQKTSKAVFTVISMATCSLIAILIHIIFRIKVSLSFESHNMLGFFETYLFLFGIPTIIYILAGGWFGWKIHSKFTTS